MATVQGNVCTQCGRANSTDAVICASCGAVLAVPGMLSDPQANIVAGAPVPEQERDSGADRGNATDRLARIGPEIATIVSDAISQRAGDLSQRVSRRGTDFGDEVARRSSHWADRVAMRSQRFADRMARREAQHRRLQEVVDSVRDLARPMPPRYPVPYAPMRANPVLPARALWFICVGTWLTGLWILATWVMLCLFVFGEQSRRMITIIPNVLTLRTAGQPPASIVPAPQAALPRVDGTTRLVYMICVGWWLSLAWMMTAYALSLTVVGIPLAYRMFSVAPTIAHL